jgi:hypothetical protein
MRMTCQREFMKLHSRPSIHRSPNRHRELGYVGTGSRAVTPGHERFPAFL